MGAGIAQIAAMHHHSVILVDRDEATVSRGIAAIEKNLDRAVEKGRLTPEQRGTIVTHIRPETAIKDFDVDIAIEAATEKLDLKLEIFRRLDQSTPPEAVLASNTSSISITTLAAATERPENVIGMHFMNPVPVMQLVEIIRGLATSDETTQRVVELSKAVGKTPVEVQDYPGFVANRILMPMINEAIYCLMEGVGTPEAIDTVMKLGMNHPMGPLALADLIGLDTCQAILEVLHDGLGDPKYRPCPLLRKYVAAGWLGRKTKRGFYAY